MIGASDRLVDARFGIVTRLARQEARPDVPPAFVAYGAELADTRRLGPWTTDRHTYGAAFFNEHQARQAAIGEAAERYCGNLVPAALPRASWRELAAAGERALDPRELTLYSTAQYAERGFPFVPLTKDLTVRWVRGRDLMTGDAVFVPASLVYLARPKAGEPPTNAIIYAGIAAGHSLEDAERAALEEIIERDAITLWWHSGAPALALRQPPVVREALATPWDSGAIRYQLIAFKTLLDVPVIGAFLEDSQHDVVALGTACRAEPAAAALKALCEAIQLRTLSLALLDPSSGVWRAMEQSIHPVTLYKPYRPDRAYLDDFRPDLRDIVDLAAQAQLYLDPRMRQHITRILAPSHELTLDDLPDVDESDPRGYYVKRLERCGLRAFSVALTTPDVRSAGLSVVRVIVPGLYSNAPPAFPLLGGRRLYEEPAALGWVPAPLAEEELVRVPPPFA